MAEKLIEKIEHYQSWVRVGGDFDHCPILLQIEKKNEKPPSPFKFGQALAAKSLWRLLSNDGLWEKLMRKNIAKD
jgi:hypothetical protein